MARAFTIHTAVSAAPEEKDDVARRTMRAVQTAASAIPPGSTVTLTGLIAGEAQPGDFVRQTDGPGMVFRVVATEPGSITVEPGGNRKQRRAQWAKARKGTV